MPRNWKKYYAASREKIKARMRKTHELHRDSVFKHYGESCQCCGEENRTFLTIDHVNNDGRNYRRSQSGNSSHNNIYAWLVRAGFPEGFQTLCRNCNWGKQIHGECPHMCEGVEIISKESRAKRPEARGPRNNGVKI